jgi:succinate dehydrogenase/fumarate reductase cytochrome b subunit
MNILNFVIVLVCAVAISSAVAVLYANAVRLLAVAKADVEGIHHMRSRIGASMCFAACAIIVLFALWLIIPVFH